MTTRRVCLLTGASTPLGDAFCRRLRDRYDIVAVCGAGTPAAPSQEEWFVDPLAPGADIAENRDRIFVVRADLAEPGAVARVVDLALARFGRVDLLVDLPAPPEPDAGLLDAGAAALRAGLDAEVTVPLALSAALAERAWTDVPANRAANRNIVTVCPDEVAGAAAVTRAARAALAAELARVCGPLGVRVNTLVAQGYPARVAPEPVLRAIVAVDRGDLTGAVHGLGAD
ncbi:SDR family NAD(P)-dependent oxidoreductase [Nocardia thailandica]